MNRQIVWVFSALSLAACGGGGGGVGGGGNNNTTQITQANSQQVAGAAADAVSALTESGEEIALNLSGANVAVGAMVSAPASPGPVGLLLRELRRLHQAGPGMPTVATGAVLEESYPCGSGNPKDGTVKVSFNDLDNNGDLSVNETVTFSLDQCKEPSGTGNGTFSVRADALNGTPGVGTPWDGTLTVTFSNLTVVEAGRTSALSGATQITLATPDEQSFDLTVTSPSFSTTENGDAYTVQDMRIESAVNAATGAYSHRFSGRLTGTPVGGTVTVSTPAPLTGTAPGYPSAGVIRVAGGDGSVVTLTALDTLSVRLDTDANGDGATDSSAQIAWQEL